MTLVWEPSLAWVGLGGGLLTAGGARWTAGGLLGPACCGSGPQLLRVSLLTQGGDKDSCSAHPQGQAAWEGFTHVPERKQLQRAPEAAQLGSSGSVRVCAHLTPSTLPHQPMHGDLCLSPPLEGGLPHTCYTCWEGYPGVRVLGQVPGCFCPIGCTPHACTHAHIHTHSRTNTHACPPYRAAAPSEVPAFEQSCAVETSKARTPENNPVEVPPAPARTHSLLHQPGGAVHTQGRRGDAAHLGTPVALLWARVGHDALFHRPALPLLQSHVPALVPSINLSEENSQ